MCNIGTYHKQLLNASKSTIIIYKLVKMCPLPCSFDLLNVVFASS